MRSGDRAAASRWRRREPWPLWALLAVAWPFTLVLLAHAYSYTSQGLIAGSPGAYADWAAHLTYAGSFAYGANFRRPSTISGPRIARVGARFEF